MKLHPIIGIGSVAALLGFAVTVMAQNAAPAAKSDAAKASPAIEKKAEIKAQATCPITGNKTDKKLFVDVEGCRIYVCCKDCIDKVKADPKTAMKKIADCGESCECVCAKCGGAMAKTASGAADSMQCVKCKAVQTMKSCCMANPSCPMKGADVKMDAPAPAAPAK